MSEEPHHRVAPHPVHGLLFILYSVSIGFGRSNPINPKRRRPLRRHGTGHHRGRPQPPEHSGHRDQSPTHDARNHSQTVGRGWDPSVRFVRREIEGRAPNTSPQAHNDTHKRLRPECTDARTLSKTTTTARKLRPSRPIADARRPNQTTPERSILGSKN